MSGDDRVNVGFARAEHEESLVGLLIELNRFYNPQSAILKSDVESHLRWNLMPSEAHQKLIVATDRAGEVVGLAAVYIVLSLVEPLPESNRQCFLKELYVRDDSRGQGIGEALMRWVIDFAKEEGCCRLDWNVQAGNHDGIRFYKSLGGYWVEDRFCFRLDGDAF